jgi:hypothetical protein
MPSFLLVCTYANQAGALCHASVRQIDCVLTPDSTDSQTGFVFAHFGGAEGNIGQLMIGSTTAPMVEAVEAVFLYNYVNVIAHVIKPATPVVQVKAARKSPSVNFSNRWLRLNCLVRNDQ